jgi:hypothetical protein
VSTTRARLQHLFGADYRFEFHRQSAGLAVIVAIPWRKELGDRVEDSPPEREHSDAGRLESAFRAVRRTAQTARQH